MPKPVNRHLGSNGSQTRHFGMILSRPVKRPIGPSADQQVTLRVDSQQSLGAVRAVFRAWNNPAVLLHNEMHVVLLIGFWQRGWMLR
jgi:hypothetical protein